MSVEVAFAEVLTRACQKHGWPMPVLALTTEEGPYEKDRAELFVAQALRAFLPAVIADQEDSDEVGAGLIEALLKIPHRGWSKERQLVPLGHLIAQTKSQQSIVYRALSNATSAVSALVHKGQLTDAAANAAHVAIECETATAFAWRCLEDSLNPGVF